MYGKKHTEEEKQNLRAKMSGSNNPHYGKKNSVETRAKISQALKGRPCTMTEEQRKERGREISAATKGRKHADGSGRPPKRILCVETGEVFASIAEAARQKEIRSKTAISRVAKGKQSLCGGYHWKYCEEED